jgi:hypothetical protein
MLKNLMKTILDGWPAQTPNVSAASLGMTTVNDRPQQNSQWRLGES